MAPQGNYSYRIRVEETIGERWHSWFDGMEMATQPDGSTLLTGPVVDQAALHGWLNRVRDLGLTLLSVERVEPNER